jgi:peptidoglycan/LPS O-acetylase OafA/YrhL
MRIEQLTFTRFLAAIAIVVFHYGQNIFPFNNIYLQGLFSKAYLGVSYFFILSGFVMVIAYYKETTIDSIDFFKRRIARIYPAYLFALLLIIFYNIWGGQSISYKGLGLSLLGMQSWLPLYALKLNAPGWSISVEFFFYALFPLLYNLLYKSIRKSILIISIMFIWIASQLLLNLLPYLPLDVFQNLSTSTKHAFLHYHPLMHLNEFLIGNMAGLVFISFSHKKRNYDLMLFLLFMALALFISFASPILNLHNGLLAVLFIPIIMLLCLNNGRITAILNKKQLVFLGEISFSIYILQAPVFMIIQKLVKAAGLQDATSTFYISLASLILLSCLSYIYLETPLRKKIKNIPLKYKEKTLLQQEELIQP